jgi:hypothetical protein
MLNKTISHIKTINTRMGGGTYLHEKYQLHLYKKGQIDLQDRETTNDHKFK